MLNSSQLKKIVTEARPLIERQLDLAEQIAGLRDVVSAAGGDWSQLKALVKAQIQDERDEAGDGKRVRKILDKADYAASYADMLGLGGSNMNEKNSFAGIENIDPFLLNMLVQGSQTEAGRAIIFAALQAVQDGDTDFDPSTGEPETPVSHAPVQPGREEPGTTDGAASAGETAKNIEPEAAMLPQTDMASAPKDPSPEPEAVESSATSSRTGAAAKALGGSGQSTSSAGMEGEADRQPHSADHTKPNPWCADPDDCGVEASWNHMCGSCLRRRDAQRSAAEAMH